MRVSSALLVLALTGAAYGTGAAMPKATAGANERSAFPVEGRFDVVQSSLSARFTFRLDRWTGRVAQLVTDAEGRLSWQNMEVRDLKVESAESAPRFHLFVSGISAIQTFLVDTVSGRTWALSGRSERDLSGSGGPAIEILYWLPMS